MLDLNQLRERCENGESFEYLFFWGHQPSKDGKPNKSCFSQWFEAPFEIGGIVYPTAEHWMMACKADLFGDEEHFEKIIQARTPKAAKALGRKVRGFDDRKWKAERRQIVTDGNLAKFRQHKEFGEFLLATESKVIVEASPYDRIWGIGLKASDERAAHPKTWRGQNLLGFALMDVRTQLAS
ncbi:Swarming motility protein YbiA [Planctomycetales bacterium 10988]|nr:Swarming motility protein YbiA [Planctomycetales bacterium 10988]